LYVAASQAVITNKANTDPREWLPGERDIAALGRRLQLPVNNGKKCLTTVRLLGREPKSI